MLNEITIENVAVIEKASASFADGFTVLTGETGAGKSILIDSINAILGNRTSKDIVRSGAQKASIWASFTGIPESSAKKLEEAGYECDGELLLSREISAEGKSTCRINGMPATAAMLREVCGGLINIHGQHDNQSLLDPAKHIDLLDAYAKNESLLENYSKVYSQLTELERNMRSLSMNEAEKSRKLDLLQYELNEIEGANLEEGEEESLTVQRNIIINSQNIIQGINGAHSALFGTDEEPGAATLLADAARQLEAAAVYSDELAPYAAQLQECYYTASEIASDMQGKLAGFEFDPREIENVEQRLDLFYRLKQKYGSTIEDVIEYGQKARQELENIQFSSQRIEEMEQQSAELQKQVQLAAQNLTDARNTAFAKLSEEIGGALEFLNMPGIAMALNNTIVPFGPKGQDELEFYISTNPGEKPKPLAKIASGGELARIMLAIKSALAEKDAVPTVIYDEIDTGISGMAAGRIGKLLHDTASGRQVICVTHTAQVAACAGRHLLIEKQVDTGRTFTSIRELDRNQRIDELARIISGDNVTDISRANAEEMLVKAQQ